LAILHGRRVGYRPFIDGAAGPMTEAEAQAAFGRADDLSARVA
jgi:hypothetical protein